MNRLIILIERIKFYFIFFKNINIGIYNFFKEFAMFNIVLIKIFLQSKYFNNKNII